MDLMGKKISVNELGLPSAFTSRYDYCAAISDDETEIFQPWDHGILR